MTILLPDVGCVSCLHYPSQDACSHDHELHNCKSQAAEREDEQGRGRLNTPYKSKYQYYSFKNSIKYLHTLKI